MDDWSLAGAILCGLAYLAGARWLEGRTRETALTLLPVLFFVLFINGGRLLTFRIHRLDQFTIFEILVVYALIGRWVMRQMTGTAREAVLVALNLAGILLILSHGQFSQLGLYLDLIGVFYLTMWWFANQPRNWPWLAFFTPLMALAFLRYGATDVESLYLWSRTRPGLGWEHLAQTLTALTGVSYLVFRCSRLVLEVRNGQVNRPNFLEYINFAFFLPTMLVGPINTYANFRRGFEGNYVVPAGRALLRVLVGAVKYFFLGTICNQLTYSGLLRDGFSHHGMDLPVAMLFFYFYLYLNFSGMCDIAIGFAGLMGIAVPENFANPFAARNVKDFWNRWHITLSAWMRDIVFSPLSKYLVGKFGLNQANQAIALTIVVVFLLIGIWHGAALNFAAYGAVHALGVVVNHYYTIWLKRKLGRDGFKAYNENRWIHGAAVGITFCYCGGSLIFFANSFSQIADILSSLK